MLTTRERALIDKLGSVMGDFVAVMDEEPGPRNDTARAGDLQEIAHHLHVLQRMVGAQAAARQYPDEFRTLGHTLPG